MATLGTGGKVTLLDWAKSLDPDGKVSAVAELLNQTNEVLLDMPWIEGNLPTGHKTVIRTGLPTAIWRQLYQGVPPSKSARAQVTEAIGMLETRSEVDVDLAKLNGNMSAFRLSEAVAFVESMNQTMAQTLIYGDSSLNPERFTGLAPRYSALTGAANIQNVIDGGSVAGQTDNTSVWLVGWGEDTIHGIFPKGSQAGLYHEDLGIIDAFDSSNNRFRAYADHWQWKCGLAVRDWRYVVRICNIDASDLTGSTGTQNAQQLIKLMIRAMQRIPMLGKCKPVFYANRTVKEMLFIQALDKSQNALGIIPAANQFGPVTAGGMGSARSDMAAGATLTFFGIPIRTVDQITLAETRLT